MASESPPPSMNYNATDGWFPAGASAGISGAEDFPHFAPQLRYQRFWGFDSGALDLKWNTNELSWRTTPLPPPAAGGRSCDLAEGQGAEHGRLVMTAVMFKRLSGPEIDQYIEGSEWRSKAGAYAIQGAAAAFVLKIIGSYSNVVGLPLAETAALLRGLGIEGGQAGKIPRAG